MRTPRTARLVESPLPRDGHGGFGERPGETDREQSRHRAPGRLNAEHWIHLRTTDPIESAFATVRLRQRVTKGQGFRAAGAAMAFKLIEAPKTAGATSTARTWLPSSAPARSSRKEC